MVPATVLALALLSALLGVAPGSAGPAAAAHSPFGDVPAGTFYTDAVDWLADAEITTGTSPSTFSPSDPVTRGQMAAFLERYAQVDGAPGTHGFADVPAGAFYDGSVSFLVDRAITTGTSATTYSPGDPVTRAQMAAFLWRFSNEPSTDAPMPFGDVPAGSYYYDAVRWLADEGITTGTSATTYSPNDIVTRAQMATFLWRLANEPSVGDLGANRIDLEATVIPDDGDIGAGSTIDETGSSQIEWMGDELPDVGDVIVAGVTDETPSGFIGEVMATSGSMVMTTPATLQDAIPEADVAASFDFDDPDLSAAGLSQSSIKDAFKGVTASCSAGGSFTVDMDLDIDSGLEFEASWSLVDGVEAFIGFTATATATIDATATGAVECEGVVSVDGPKLKALTFWIGAVPVVLIPEITFEGVIGGSFSASATAGFTYTQTVDAGLRFADDRWSTEYTNTRDSFFRPPTFAGQATAGIQLRARLDVKAYGGAGPYLTVGPFFEINAQNDIPWWNIDAGVKASIGAEVDLVFFKDEVEFAEIDLVRFRLADSETSGDPLPPGGLAILAGLPLTSVTSSGANSCGVDAVGNVHCWGDNSYGQIGDGSTVAQRNVGTRVKFINDAVDVAVGGTHACALRNGGRVSCWGDNTWGELGDGTTDSSSIPVDVVGITNAIAVEAAPTASCAILADYTVRCWGRNSNGQLGDGTTTDRSTPVMVPGLDIVTDLSMGNGFTCARRATGDVRCWGYGYGGELGNGATGPGAAVTPDPVVVSGLDDATEIDSGSLHTCARRADGTAVCWGAGRSYQLGNTIIADSAVPTPVIGLDNVTAITAGGASSCALVSDGPAQCWGSDQNGQIGNGLDGHVNLDQPYPVAVLNGDDFSGIDAGGQHTCAVYKARKVVCWGNNNFGELGDGTAPVDRSQLSKLVQGPTT